MAKSPTLTAFEFVVLWLISAGLPLKVLPGDVFGTSFLLLAFIAWTCLRGEAASDIGGRMPGRIDLVLACWLLILVRAGYLVTIEAPESPIRPRTELHTLKTSPN